MPTKKGKLEDAKNGEVNNLIRVAYESRMLPLKIIRPKTDENGDVVLSVVDDDGDLVDEDGDDSMVDDNDGDAAIVELNPPRLIVDLTAPVVTPPRPNKESTHSPSYFLNSPVYLQLAKDNIKGTFNIEFPTTTEEKNEFADKIGRLLHRRLAKHIQSKIDDPKKHNHPVLLFVRSNLNRFAALLCFYDQARSNPVLNVKMCILKYP